MTAGKQPLDRLFRPRSIAIVGASATPDKAGYKLVEALGRFPGDVFPINPRGGEILGRTVYPDLRDLPAAPDFVVMGIPARACPEALRAAAEIGAGAGMIVSGGFGEAGGEGEALQAELAAICAETGIRLLGPNTSGFLAPGQDLLATFLPSAATIASGPAAIVAQSGGVNFALAFAAAAEGLGLALSVGLGNAVDVDAATVLEHLGERDDVRAVGLHLEGVPDGRRLHDVLCRVTAHKPVVVLPVGRTDIGAFARSHTGNLMGRFALTRAALEQAGAVVVDDTRSVVDALGAFVRTRLPARREPGVGVLTGQAGPGLIIADALKAEHVSVPPLPEATRAEIGELLPPMTFMENPVDTGRPGPSYGPILELVGRTEGIDAVLAYALYEEDSVEPETMIAPFAVAGGVPVVFGTGGTVADMARIRPAMQEAGIPTYPSPEQAARVTAALVADARLAWLRERRAAAAGRPGAVAADPPASLLDEAGAKRIVEGFGLAVPRGRACASREEAAAALADLRRPVVVKLLDPAVQHKTEAGGVVVGVGSEAALEAALDRIDRAAGGTAPAYLVEEMAGDGPELILGGANDPSWGATVLVGLGGVMAEALGDSAMALAPFGPDDALAMLDRLSGSVLLDGWRGAPAVDRDALATILVSLGDFLVANPWVAEIDINPVRATADGLVALDALIVAWT